MGSATPRATTVTGATTATTATTATGATVRPEWCSARSAAVDEPTAGTAPRALAWIVIEQPGPWGREAAVDSRLDPAIGRELLRRAGAAGARVALVRRPGTHPDEPGGPRRLWLAYTAPGRTWLWQGRFTDPRRLLDLDVAAIAAGDAPDPAFDPHCVAPAEPILLVCTNARRDRCCAVSGRPLARAVAASHPGQVWESSHLGGHRFAATAVVLPTGYAYGRLDVAGARAVLAEAAGGVLHPAGVRGRSTFPPAAQVAEIEVRRRTGDWAEGALYATEQPAPAGGGADATVLVTHRDGRRWRAVVTREVDGERLRPDSCGKPAVPVASYRVRRLAPG